MVHLNVAKTESPVREEEKHEIYHPEHSSQRKERRSKALSGAEVTKLLKAKQTAILERETVMRSRIASPTDINEPLTTGYFKSARGKSPSGNSTSNNAPSFLIDSHGVPRKHSRSRQRSPHRRRPLPPWQFVEDELKSLAREASASKIPSYDPPMRDVIKQNPFILEANVTHKDSAYRGAGPSFDDLDRPEGIFSLETFDDDSFDDESLYGEAPSRKADKMASTPSSGNRLEKKDVEKTHTPQSSSGSEDLTLKDSQREKFLSTIFEENGAFTSHSPGTSTGSEGRKNTSQADQTPSSSTASRSSYSDRRGTSQKRKQTSNDEDEQHHPERPRKQGRPSPPQHPERKSNRGRRLACPFHLLDKQFYCKNNRTGKKYETCSGPGWYTMHHLKQHLGDSASSVHKKIRCPRCLKPFKSWKEEGKHLAGDECSGTPDRNYDYDDISDRRWDKIEKNVSRAAFEKLSVSYQNKIDIWVLDHLESYAPHDAIDSRKGELRKWHMIWDILVFNVFVESGQPAPPPFYMDSQENISSNTDLLLRTFKEVVDASVENGEIEGITDENLEKLQKCLEVAIGRATQDVKERSSENDPSQMQDLLREDPLALSMLDPAQGTSAWNPLDTQMQSQMQPFGNPFGSNPADASTSMTEGYMLDQLDDADWQQFMEETRP